jgi:hypothetical protein
LLLWNIPLPVQSEKIGILLVVDKLETNKTEIIQQVVDWKINQGFEVWISRIDDFINASEIKTYLQKFYKSHPNMQYAVLPPHSFEGKIKVKIDGKEYEFVSDKYFENLDDDPLFDPEIMISRATITELGDISLRNNLNQLTCNIGFPMISYDRWACVPGECLQYVKCDASHLGDDIKRLFTRKKIKTVTFYEQEGISKSFLKPDFPISEETISKSLEQSNIIWYLNTLEPLQPKPEGYVLYSTYSEFNRAIWVNDNNQDKLITDSELDIKPFFSFSDAKSTVHRIGFLPLFVNDKMNLNQFSSLIGISPIDGCSYVPDDGTGIGPSVLSLYRMVMENLVNGKTVGESIQVFNQYREQYATDPNHQEYFALGLFVRGDPTVRIQDLVEKAKLEITPEEIETTSILSIPMEKTEAVCNVKNSGTTPLRVSIDFNRNLLEISPKECFLEPGMSQEIKIKIQTSVRQFFKVNRYLSTPKKKQTVITIKSNARNKSLKVIWFST